MYGVKSVRSWELSAVDIFWATRYPWWEIFWGGNFPITMIFVHEHHHEKIYSRIDYMGWRVGKSILINMRSESVREFMMRRPL